MKNLRHIPGISTLALKEDACVGCGECEKVCPHAVFSVSGGKARIIDFDACMECGACANNCPADAIEITPGVGCAAYIIQSWIFGEEKATCC